MKRLDLDPTLVEALSRQLPAVAEGTVTAITAEVPDYSDAFSGEMGATIQGAVQMALAGFLRLVSHGAPEPTDGIPEVGGVPLGPVREGAYALGRGEARSGRTMDALLAAYRVGARESWRDLSATAVGAGLPAADVARFAELVFAYIDELSASSVAGHTDELATSGRVREQYLERLGRALLDGADPDDLLAAAALADWAPPATLTAVLLPGAHVRSVLSGLPAHTLVVSSDVAGLDDHAVLLVPGDGRAPLLQLLRQRPAIVGPARSWTGVRASYERAVRGLALPPVNGVLDTDEHLTALVLTADPEALADLRAQALAPLSDLRPATAERLAETLRAWLLHQGRRDDVAAHLVVHAQTVRYRMTQLRELYGDQLTDPESVLRLTTALGVDVRPDGPR